MEKANIWPLATPKPLKQSLPKLARMIRSWTAPSMQNFVAISSGVSAPQICAFAVPSMWLVCSFFGVLHSSIRIQPTPLNGFLRTIHQNTSFRVRKCLLVETIFNILDPYISKNRQSGDQLWLDFVFLAAENHFNIGVLLYELPLIVIVAP